MGILKGGLSPFLQPYLAHKADFDPELYGCHSIRSGGATFLSEAGVTDFSIKLQGFWKSEAYLCYLQISLEWHWAFPELMSSASLVSSVFIGQLSHYWVVSRSVPEFRFCNFRARVQMQSPQYNLLFVIPLRLSLFPLPPPLHLSTGSFRCVINGPFIYCTGRSD
jgi:hypothetical protein